MTVIACDRLSMAADSALWDGGDNTRAHGRKLFRWQDDLFGVAGEYVNCLGLMEAIKGDGKKQPRYPGAIVMRLTKTGSILIYEQRLEPYEISDPFYAIGIGALGAICAMAAGADAKTAVEIVTTYHPDCDKPIHCYRLAKS